MDDKIERPAEIAAQSFKVIRAEMHEMGYHFAAHQQAVIERVIHSTADFEFADLIQFSPAAIPHGIAALQRSAPIVTDVNMVRIGINQRRAQGLGSTIHCYVGDVSAEDTAANGLTRTAAGLHLAHEKGLLANAIVVIGNAPTALFSVIDLIEQQGV
ncbi:MAG: precorrin-8X methylmutase, partial [Chloroflexota bacterium]